MTTAQIAKTAGISPRSFFRYFESKEDVVLIGLAEAGRRVAEVLHSRPASEPAWEALRHALHVLVETPVYPAEDIHAIAGIILGTPSIQAREFHKQRQWETLLVPEVARRLLPLPSPVPVDEEERAKALVGAAMACLRVATEGWLKSDGSADPITVLDTLMATVQPA